MILEKLHIIITLFAALVVTIVCILTDTALFNASLRLIVTIVSFYFIGLFAKMYLEKNVFPKQEEVKEEAKAEEAEAVLDSNPEGEQIAENLEYMELE